MNKYPPEISAFNQSILKNVPIKEIQELARVASELNEMNGLRQAFEESTKLLSSLVESALNIPEQLISPYTNQVIQAIKTMQEQLNIPNWENLGTKLAALDSTTFCQSALLMHTEALREIEGIYIDLPLAEIHKSLDEYRNLSIEINEFRPYKNSFNEYCLTTTTSQLTDLGFLKLKIVQQTQLQVQSLQEDVNEIKEIVIVDGKKKDEMLEELLDYFRIGGTRTVKIKKVKYNKRTAELIIDDNLIYIKPYTKQHDLCNILFASKKSMKKVWEIVDIVEAMGEYEFNSEWTNKIYNTVRHLNEKIQIKTEIERFILYESKTVLVNPKYLDLT